MVSNWERTGTIIKETFALAGKDKSLFIPPFLSMVFGIVFAAVAMVIIFTGNVVGGGNIPAAFFLFALLILFVGYLASAVFSAALSWMTLEVVHGKDTTLGSGLARAVKKFGSLALYALVSLLVMLFVSQLRDNKKDNLIMSIIRNLLAGVIEKTWDIASHFMLPAIALTDKGFVGAAKELPVLLKHLPETLVGGFAFDFVVRWVYLLDIILALLVGFLFFAISPILGILVGLGLLFLLVVATYVFYDFVKSVYFTMMYIELHPELKSKRALKK
jgi:hypothetical protein